MKKTSAVCGCMFGVALLAFLTLSSCNYTGPGTYRIRVHYDSQFDANELWLYQPDVNGNPVTRLITEDLTVFVPGTTRYRQDLDLYLEKKHDPAEEPNIHPYYYFKYVQQKLELKNEPIYRPEPIITEGFAVHVNHLGEGYALLEEWMYINDFEPEAYHSMFIQYYCGPDLFIHSYRPSSKEHSIGPATCEQPTPTPTDTPSLPETPTAMPEVMTLTPTSRF
jgi:hypothetical protein